MRAQPKIKAGYSQQAIDFEERWGDNEAEQDELSMEDLCATPAPPRTHTHHTHSDATFHVPRWRTGSLCCGGRSNSNVPPLCSLSCYIPEISVCCVRLSRKKLIGYLVAMAVMTLVFTQLNPHGSAV